MMYKVDKLDQNSTRQTCTVTNGNYNIPRSKTKKGKSAIACAGPVTRNINVNEYKIVFSITN